MSAPHPLLIALTFVLLVPSGGLAVHAQSSPQARLVGVVRDAETNAFLPGAHVFIAASMIGTTTDSTGRFDLREIPLGAHRLYVSMLGYEPAVLDTLLQSATTDTLAFELKPTVLSAGEVTVTAERDKDWYKRLQKFKRLFIGTSRRADECTLLNPEVLAFETRWWGRFKAFARAPLLIENRALGYRIRYHLDEFRASGGTVRWDGEPFFEPLTPADSAEAVAWATNRRKAYSGSMRHFLRALRSDRLREAGFTVYHHPNEAFRSTSSRFRVRARRLIKPAAEDSVSTLNFFGRLEIIYRHEQEDNRFLRWAGAYHRRASGLQTSHLELNEHPVTVDASGEIVEPYGATVYGHFAFERLADAVPREYALPSPR
jgi:hypothetical protein